MTCKMNALEATTATFPKHLVSCAHRYLANNEQLLEMAQQNGLARGQAKDVVLTTGNRIYSCVGIGSGA